MKCLTTFLVLCIVYSQEVSISTSFPKPADEDLTVKSRELAQTLWQEFKLTYNKHYKNEEEESYRMQIFMQNALKISQHNQKLVQGLAFSKGAINPFTDMPLTEFLRTHTGIVGADSYFATNESQEAVRFIPPAHVTLPDEVDWRKQGAVTPIKDQRHCGSCYSFSAVGALEGQHFRREDELVSLSEQQIVDCSWNSGNKGCAGGLPSQSFNYIKKNDGIDTEEAYPYNGEVEKCHYDPEKKGATDRGYVIVNLGNETELQAAVATIGPIAVLIDADHFSFQIYTPGKVYYEPKCKSDPGSLTHAVVIVGYGREPKDKHPDYWLVKNSWGDKWGDTGYIKMARNEDNNCGIATFPTYPLV